MADKKDKKDKAENSEKKEKSGKGVMAILFILGLLVIGAAAFGGTYLFMQTKSKVSAEPVLIEKAYADLAEITVNLADEGGKRYFKGQISVGYDTRNTKLAEEIKNNMVVVRDATIFYLKGQKADFINKAENEEEIKKQLIVAINKKLVTGKIEDISFNNILIQ